VLRAEAVDRIRPYSERWFMYIEDLDLCWRLTSSGWRCRLEADIAIPHVGKASSGQAWGDNPMTRWLPASYDWYAETHGEWAMRGWALVNAAGIASHLAMSAATGLTGVRSRRRQARARTRQLASQLPIHARAVIRRPSVPDSPPT